MSAPQNRAAWLVAANQHPFEVRSAPMPSPSPTEIVIQVGAAAINPADPIIQEKGLLVPFYPFVLGFDMAGTVTAVGSEVTDLAPGDRVAAYADGLLTQRASNAGFQLYAATGAACAARIPDATSFAQACVLPICLATAASGLLMADRLGLEFPKADPPPANGKWVFVWAGSTSVGSCAIMMCKAAGYQVAATASPKNFDYLKSMGADAVFDSYSTTLVDDAIAALKGKSFAGIYEALGELSGQADHSIEIACKLAAGLDGVKKVTTVNPRVNMDLVPGDVSVSIAYSIGLSPDVQKAVFCDYIYQALSNGTLQCKPEPRVVGKGLEHLQDACDLVKKGVSATKVVVEL